MCHIELRHYTCGHKVLMGGGVHCCPSAAGPFGVKCEPVTPLIFLDEVNVCDECSRAASRGEVVAAGPHNLPIPPRITAFLRGDVPLPPPSPPKVHPELVAYLARCGIVGGDSRACSSTSGSVVGSDDGSEKGDGDGIGDARKDEVPGSASDEENEAPKRVEGKEEDAAAAAAEEEGAVNLTKKWQRSLKDPAPSTEVELEETKYSVNIAPSTIPLPPSPDPNSRTGRVSFDEVDDQEPDATESVRMSLAAGRTAHARRGDTRKCWEKQRGF
ncbi:MAG: hypothetical protein M1827_005380 [Pycnora praestabilis]|nr:MAG: hypothetical protein M1827_005380 [Pycnora praestabilis]